MQCMQRNTVGLYAFDAGRKGPKIRIWRRSEVSIEVEVADALQVDVTRTFDVVGLIFAHMPVSCENGSTKAWSWVKPGGRLIVEGFHKTQLGLGSGGRSVWTCSTTREHLWRTS